MRANVFIISTLMATSAFAGVRNTEEVKSSASVAPPVSEQEIKTIYKKDKDLTVHKEKKRSGDSSKENQGSKGLKTKASEKRVERKTKPFSVTLLVGSMTNYSSAGVEFEFREDNWGVGGFILGTDISNTEKSINLKGLSAGVLSHYHFFPGWYTQTRQVFDSGAYGFLGISKLNSSIQGELPLYLMGGFGLDTSYLLSKEYGVSAYSRIGINYMFHSDSGLMYSGADVTLGLKWSF